MSKIQCFFFRMEEEKKFTEKVKEDKEFTQKVDVNFNYEIKKRSKKEFFLLLI